MEKHLYDQSQSAEFLKCLGGFFKRELISIPLIKKHPHPSVGQRCNLKAATLELDTAAYPNIEYIAGTRLSVYPPNPHDQVSFLLKHLVDDVAPAPPAASPGSPPKSQTHPATGGKRAADGPSASKSTSTKTTASQKQHQHRQSISNLLVGNNVRQLDDNWGPFVATCGRDSLRLALLYLYDITTAPTRELIQIMAENCANREHRQALLAISSSDDAWERWVCQTQRTIKSTFEEFGSCKLSAKCLLSELAFQQPRQYSIASIKSTKRFRAEIIVFQHKFTPSHIYNNIQNVKERERLQGAASPGQLISLRAVKAAGRQLVGPARNQPQAQPTAASSQTATSSGRSAIRSLRSMTPVSSSPITTHQVSRVPSYSGPLMNIYATSTLSSMGPASSGLARAGAAKSAPGSSAAGGVHQQRSQRSKSASSSAHSPPGGASSGPDGPVNRGKSNQSQSAAHKPQRSASSRRDNSTNSKQLRSSASLLSQAGQTDAENSVLGRQHHHPQQQQQQQHHNQQQQQRSRRLASHHSHADQQAPSKQLFDGLCSNYLLNLNPNEHIVCEFVENPRFTLKGNRERPIMMIGQDVGVVAFRPFWQQRSIEHDRAQVFYTLFKDLSRKKFGDMQLVCLVGNRCKVEDLFRNEINSNLTNKILSTVLYINRNHFEGLLDATLKKGDQMSSSTSALQAIHSQSLQIDSKELVDLGNRIYKLLIEQNGCLYTCCDPQLTQAIEILTVESIARNNSTLTRERIMTLLPHWKGRGKAENTSGAASTTTSTAAAGAPDNDNNFLYTLENQFERARIVQEIYDASI